MGFLGDGLMNTNKLRGPISRPLFANHEGPILLEASQVQDGSSQTAGASRFIC